MSDDRGRFGALVAALSERAEELDAEAEAARRQRLRADDSAGLDMIRSEARAAGLRDAIAIVMRAWRGREAAPHLTERERDRWQETCSEADLFKCYVIGAWRPNSER